MRWNNSVSVMSLMLSVLFYALSGFGEEVCKFENQGLPEKLNGDTLVVHEKNVAMSNYVQVGDPSDIVTVGNPCSIMFLVDVSGSNTTDKTDWNGVRFNVIVDVLDSIYKKNPQVQVGLILFASGLWFYPPDDPLFAAMGGSGSNGYVPLLQLDKEYSGIYTEADHWGKIKSQNPYTMKGIDVLKMYLEIVPNWHTLVGGNIAKYNPSNSVGGLTNITMAFNAAKEALGNSPHNPDKRFNIFFSDGYATQGGNAYIDGVDVPTTFTIYYNPINQSDLAVLNQMTNNIKSNGYSVSNPMSNIWDMAMEHKALVNLLIDNVISKIITNVVTFETTDIEVNGLGEISGTDENGFYFKNLFPLEGEYTDFGYEITYHCRKDSITDKGDTIHVKSWDTTHTVDYTVKIEQNAPDPDSVTFTYWGRNLEFYHNGSKIDLIDESMNEVEIRFTEYEVDTLYEYKRADVEVTNVEGPIDSENLELENKGSYFSCMLPLSQSGGAKNDGTLQHQNPDTLVATFRNPKLPLDTLQVKIPYFEEWRYTLTGAAYFDNNADGHVDSIFLDVDGQKVQEHVDSIMAYIELPAFRMFAIDTYSAVEHGIALTVTENMSAVNTAATSDDKVIVAETKELDGDIVIQKADVAVVDKVAPVIMSANLRDSADVASRDELTVTFSEEITESSESRPFLYYSTGEGKEFKATLTLLSHNKTSALYEVKSLDGVDAIVDGDSIRISANASDVVSDVVHNRQNNGDNIHREIEVTIIDKGMYLRRAAYYDDNADGHIDRINLPVEGGELQQADAEKLADKLLLPDFRSFTVQSVKRRPDGLELSVAEGGEILTSTTAEDVILLVDTLFLDADDAYIVHDTVAIEDKVAPIVMRASLRDSAEVSSRDELSVTYSEEVKGSSEATPLLYFAKGENKNFTATLSLLEHKGTTTLYEVVSLDGVDAIIDGDSLWINAAASEVISDIVDNAQLNSSNIHREIEVTIIDKGMYLREASYYDDNADGHIDRIAVPVDGGELQQKDAEKLASTLLLPDFRTFTVTSVHVISGGLELLVDEGGAVLTSTTSDDLIMLKDTLFLDADDAYVVHDTITIADKVAPVIMSAALLDSAKVDTRDELTLLFSEKLGNIPRDNPFELFATEDGTSYGAALSVIDNQGERITFEVLSITGQDKILNGDSIWINSTISGPVGDKADNRQENSNNIRREIDVTVIEEGLYLASAAYYDNNADGHIDSLYVNLYGKDSEIEHYTDTLVTLIEFPAFRHFEILSYAYDAGGIAFQLNEDRSEIETAVTDDDILRIKDTVSFETDSMLILPSTISIEDSVAPIIMRATYIDSVVVFKQGGKDSITTLGEDSLFITFSEDFDAIDAIDPYIFTTNDGADYFELDLSDIGKQGNRMIYTVNDIIAIDKISEGDSVHINESDPVLDLAGNRQDNKQNSYCPIIVEEAIRDSIIPLPFDFVVHSTVLDKSESFDIGSLADIPEIEDMLKEIQESDDGEYSGVMVITVTPNPVENVTIYDEYEVNHIAILDKVGNVIVADKQMVYNEQTKQLVMIWNGRNSLNREVGSGSYVALIPIEYTFNKGVTKTILKQTMISIKE